jgi:hypothetical protein
VTRFTATAFLPEEVYTALLVVPEIGATKLFHPLPIWTVTLLGEAGGGVGATRVGPGVGVAAGTVGVGTGVGMAGGVGVAGLVA